jgi:hypothetical protein
MGVPFMKDMRQTAHESFCRQPFQGCRRFRPQTPGDVDFSRIGLWSSRQFGSRPARFNNFLLQKAGFSLHGFVRAFDFP